MSAQSQAAIASGLYVEFLDLAGHTVGRAVFPEWDGTPIPAPGQRVFCEAAAGPASQLRGLHGIVLHRNFDVQTNDDGEPCVWAYLVARVAAAPAPKTPRGRRRVNASAN